MDYSFGSAMRYLLFLCFRNDAFIVIILPIKNYILSIFSAPDEDGAVQVNITRKMPLPCILESHAEFLVIQLQ